MTWESAKAKSNGVNGYPSFSTQGKGFFTTPVLLHGASPKAEDAVHMHEVFGPVATVMPYDDVKGAAGLVAAGGGGLVTSIYADDKDSADSYGQGSKQFGAGWYVLKPDGSKIDKG